MPDSRSGCAAVTRCTCSHPSQRPAFDTQDWNNTRRLRGGSVGLSNFVLFSVSSSDAFGKLPDRSWRLILALLRKAAASSMLAFLAFLALSLAARSDAAAQSSANQRSASYRRLVDQWPGSGIATQPRAAEAMRESGTLPNSASCLYNITAPGLRLEIRY